MVGQKQLEIYSSDLHRASQTAAAIARRFGLHALDGRRQIAICPAREVSWFRICPISYSEKGDIDVQIGRRREASPLNVGFPTGSRIRQPIVK
ncbi:histidine phosphatase family protein [Mesorhizobium sp. M0959]|uniref:hypothetical protein n=1 Tax=Mesorhizobium sp. M0959 TaxID=2957034 RepID=UPI00333538A1